MRVIQRKNVAAISFGLDKRAINDLLQSTATGTKQIKQILGHFIRHSPFSFSQYLCNSILFAYARSSSPSGAFAFFATQMRGIKPTSITLQFLLKSCARSKSLVQILQIHSVALKLGFSADTFIQNAIIHCYALCALVIEARRVFDELPQRDVVSFNSMIHCFAAAGDMESAIALCLQIPAPTVVTWTAVVTGFSSNGNVVEARRVFDEMPLRDLVSWNAMISGYVQNQHPLEALELFQEMQVQNFKPNAVTVASVLSACASLGALDAGKWIHVYLNKNHFLMNPFLGSSLIDMYSKCGALDLALGIFETLEEQNTCTWNAMINGLAKSGHTKATLELFSRMQLEKDVQPDEVTFVGVLLACSHGGLVEEGRKYFYHTMKKFGVVKLVEHYACIVDLLGRCGQLREAEEVVKSMPIEPDDVVWRALLAGCRLHKNAELAETVVFEMKALSSGDYVLLGNLYASVGRWDDVQNVRKIMKQRGITKIPGCSSIVVNNVIHEFISGDKSHPRYSEIHEHLEELRRRANLDGYLTEVSSALHDIDEEEKEQSLGHHSEKLAVSFGLMSTIPGSTLRIMKNLRICNDCHHMIKFVSKISEREILVRDRIRFHQFKDGVCSCNDYW